MTKDLRKLGSVRKISKLYRIIAQHLVFKVLSILAKKSGKTVIELPRSAFFFKYFVRNCGLVSLPFVGTKGFNTYVQCFGCLILATYLAVVLALTVKFSFF